jgi:hypothetical protein
VFQFLQGLWNKPKRETREEFLTRNIYAAEAVYLWAKEDKDAEHCKRLLQEIADMENERREIKRCRIEKEWGYERPRVECW